MRNIPVLVMQSTPVMVGTAEVLVLMVGTAPEVVLVVGTAEMLGVWLMLVLELLAVVVSVAGAAPEALVEGVVRATGSWA